MAKKRQWSRAFTPRTKGGQNVQINVSNVPVRLRQRFQAKCRREKKSQRHLLLSWMQNWTEGRRPDEADPSIIVDDVKNLENGINEMV